MFLTWQKFAVNKVAVFRLDIYDRTRFGSWCIFKSHIANRYLLS